MGTALTDRLQETRRITDALLDWVRGRGKIVIVVHDNPDPDCLASALALRHLFVMKLNRESVVTFSGIIGRSENIAMAHELQIPLTPLGMVDLTDYQVVCMLDTQPGTGNNAVPAEARVDLVIDHHPLRDRTRQSRWVDVREEYGVTATILYEYLTAQQVPISTKLATALFYAIKSETQDLGREANDYDRDAYHRLFPLTNKRLLYQITHPRQPIDYYRTIQRALNNVAIYGPLLVVNLERVIFPEMVAEMADFLIRLEQIETVLSIGHYSDGVVFSMRTASHELNAGEISRRLVQGLGAAGGHGMMAGGKIESVPPDGEAIAGIVKILTERFLAEFEAQDTPPRGLADR
ncbi:DHH family phosphoesterase [Geobacter argillaceus]|uniref:NanoRNase/pAp phosphatase (C-di-AMP/oligoRNAs hydrolase) n=1 Tax=Geobacter argillaceus TaxID=345631 RepID=A0A562W8R9_9BACT|nr:DHH family phosphoesterase [Geobacter argillaceus]TWJ26525.1 nanoRNase/pAp phosphatase (c-di-AMP/oligoRNAs hydrolase) [Geobacter argillaceus]